MPKAVLFRFYRTILLGVVAYGFALCLGSAAEQRPTKELPYKASGIAEVWVKEQSCQLLKEDQSKSPCIVLEGHDEGNATHLGKYHSHHKIIMYQTFAENGEDIWILDGETVIVSANGDTITSHFKVRQPVVESPSNYPVPIKGHYQIKGGTGRFEGAGGTGKVQGFNFGDGTFVYESLGRISIVAGSR